MHLKGALSLQRTFLSWLQAPGSGTLSRLTQQSWWLLLALRYHDYDVNVTTNLPSTQAAVRRSSTCPRCQNCPRPCSPTTHKATFWPPCTPSSCLWAGPARCPTVCCTAPSWPVPDPGTPVLTRLQSSPELSFKMQPLEFLSRCLVSRWMMDEVNCIFNRKPWWRSGRTMFGFTRGSGDSYWLEIHPTTGGPQQPIRFEYLWSLMLDGVEVWEGLTGSGPEPNRAREAPFPGLGLGDYIWIQQILPKFKFKFYLNLPNSHSEESQNSSKQPPRDSF